MRGRIAAVEDDAERRARGEIGALAAASTR
jgi:hypothetical protein